MSLNEFLVWLSAGGSVVAVSWACEQWGFFQTLNANAKRLAMWASASGLGMGALAIIKFVPAESLASAAPFMEVAIANFTAIFLLEVFHRFNKEQPKG
jgi:hypothetical protein